MDEAVLCYSGNEYAERPTALRWQGQRLEITTLLAIWRTPEGKAFRVVTQDNQEFELFYDEQSDTWFIQQN
jgi:hypothetical protein